MIKISELKEGNLVHILDEGMEKQGRVEEVSREEGQACINNGVQDFWYNADVIVPIPMSEERLINLLGFEKEQMADGIKYKKGAFRILAKDPGNYTNLELWYREDHRHFNHPLYLHELQNHHLDMTKVPLEGITAH